MSKKLKLLSALVISLATLFAGFALHCLADSPKSMQLFVTPHPDDEVQAWSALSASPNIYTVFLTVTNDDATDHCNPKNVARALSKQLGDFIPDSLPTITEGVDESLRDRACRQARRDSWNHFLDAASAVNASAALGDNVKSMEIVAGGTRTQAWVGSNSARFMADLGDSKVTVFGVKSVMKDVLAQRGKSLPDYPLNSIVSAAYFNDPEATITDGTDSASEAYKYPHPDHGAVSRGVLESSDLAADGVWVATHPFNPRATDMFTIRQTEWDQLMGLSYPDGRIWYGWQEAMQRVHLKVGSKPYRGILKYPYLDEALPEYAEVSGLLHTGLHQEAYGWLQKYEWMPGEYNLANSGALFARHQFFIHIPRGGDSQ